MTSSDLTKTANQVALLLKAPKKSKTPPPTEITLQIETVKKMTHACTVLARIAKLAEPNAEAVSTSTRTSEAVAAGRAEVWALIIQELDQLK